ncbi:hypothetical protein RRG08_024900 [Elysia crispata]|uniref:Uncharacterized protein n=1 Tax=Elysia crispata TaxID=231223 RepID=A0AAE1E7D3_9GAST|nr:hypothetical protein RRG08_024900 [Elysia crispata]
MTKRSPRPSGMCGLFDFAGSPHCCVWGSHVDRGQPRGNHNIRFDCGTLPPLLLLAFAWVVYGFASPHFSLDRDLGVTDNKGSDIVKRKSARPGSAKFPVLIHRDFTRANLPPSCQAGMKSRLSGQEYKTTSWTSSRRFLSLLQKSSIDPDLAKFWTSYPTCFWPTRLIPSRTRPRFTSVLPCRRSSTTGGVAGTLNSSDHLHYLTFSSCHGHGSYGLDLSAVRSIVQTFSPRPVCGIVI